MIFEAATREALRRRTRRVKAGAVTACVLGAVYLAYTTNGFWL